jgi:hypothetical protein
MADDLTRPQCSPCLTREKSAWRRNGDTGTQLYNACGVDLGVLKGKDRFVKPRTIKKVSQASWYPEAKRIGI